MSGFERHLAIAVLSIALVAANAELGAQTATPQPPAPLSPAVPARGHFDVFQGRVQVGF